MEGARRPSRPSSAWASHDGGTAAIADVSARRPAPGVVALATFDPEQRERSISKEQDHQLDADPAKAGGRIERPLPIPHGVEAICMPQGMQSYEDHSLRSQAAAGPANGSTGRALRWGGSGRRESVQSPE